MPRRVIVSGLRRTRPQLVVLLLVASLLIAPRARAQDDSTAHAAVPIASPPKTDTPPNRIPAPPAETLLAQATESYRKDSAANRRAAIGLLAGGSAALVLGAVFVGLAKSANDDATANNVYDPPAEDRRNVFEVTQTIFFSIGVSALVSGIILFADHRSGQ